MNLISVCSDLCFNPRHTKWIAPLLALGDALLCFLVVWKVPYTEIDWTTYMEQISLYISGERDYTLIKGSTGPLVYPAGHVYFYTFLHHLTDGGRDIFLGQILFGFLYLVTLVVVMACYRQAGAPPYLFPLLVLSKRLHSIFLLRLFNDGPAALAMWVSIFLFMNRKWTAGTVVWSVGVSIKMTLLLLVPGIGVVMLRSLPFTKCVGLGVVALLVQVLLGAPFLQSNPVGYISRAFELTRQFMFKWTVNWRFIGEKIFLSPGFSLALVITHISLIGLFVNIFCPRPAGCSLFQHIRNLMRHREEKLSKPFITTVLLTSLAIGLLCARSLHYQFFAYLAWATPFLFWRAGVHPILLYILSTHQEWAWNVYPSSNFSSVAVVIVLCNQVFGVLVKEATGSIMGRLVRD